VNPKLYILRGMPGSGKSTFAKNRWPGLTPVSLAPAGWSPVSVSADHFFTDIVTGEWNYDGAKVGQAHSVAKIGLLRALEAQIPEVVVDNTHSRRWEYAEHIELARVFGYEVEVIDLFDGGCTDEELAERQKATHNVPIEYIAKQRERWEHEEE
jgi:predicted kinase